MKPENFIERVFSCQHRDFGVYGVVSITFHFPTWGYVSVVSKRGNRGEFMFQLTNEAFDADAFLGEIRRYIDGV